ncbi:MAG: glycosyltransferase family 1 protein [Hyphomicrobiales bacterium]|nr:glycosyltransferase family 1 protein [Hyphomicrobiales bacterium]
MHSGLRRKLLIVTDAWRPQINGVVQTYLWLQQELPALGIDVDFLTPQGFRTCAMPSYRDIRLSLTSKKVVRERIERSGPDMIHIATEGPLGWHARRVCLSDEFPFSTCYHTRYPEYVAARLPVPLAWTYAVMRRFHNASASTLVATTDLARELGQRGFRHIRHWRRGIDVELFRSGPVAELAFPRPWFLFVGRVAVEKNIEAFLSLDLPGTKIVVGDGPARMRLERDFPAARFLGAKFADELGSIYRAADVFVFPSRTDTYGLVMAEALAAGTPVAAYPGPGVETIFDGASCGVVGNDLRKAALAALEVDPDICRRTGARHSIQASARAFLALLEPADRSVSLAGA